MLSLMCFLSLWHQQPVGCCLNLPLDCWWCERHWKQYHCIVCNLPLKYHHQFNTWVILCACHSQYWFLTSRSSVDLWYKVIFLNACVLSWMIPLCAVFSKWNCSCLKGKLELSSLCLPSLSTGLLYSWSALSRQSYSCCNSLAPLAVVILSHKNRKGSRFISVQKVGPIFCSPEVSLSSWRLSPSDLSFSFYQGRQ